MKKTAMALAFVFALCVSSAFSQITITEADVSNFFAIGTTHTTSTATPGSVDIGIQGGGNTWDFSSFNADLIVTTTSIDTAGTPFINDFAGANVCQFNTTFQLRPAGDSTKIDTWIYSKLGSGTFELLGDGRFLFFEGSDDYTSRNDYMPPKLLFDFPVSSGSSWSSMNSQVTRTESGGIPLGAIRLERETTNNVDAHGTVIFPGGRSENALRIRQENVLRTVPPAPPFRIKAVDYVFIAKSGESITITISDTVTTSGAADGLSISWTESKNATSVDDGQVVPSDFSLAQNHPNPFNPETVIEYQIPNGGKVRLTIYNALGQKIRSLVEENQLGGSYQVLWDGRDDFGKQVSTGVYLYRLESLGATQTKKMLLLK